MLVLLKRNYIRIRKKHRHIQMVLQHTLKYGRRTRSTTAVQ